MKIYKFVIETSGFGHKLESKEKTSEKYIDIKSKLNKKEEKKKERKKNCQVQRFYKPHVGWIGVR